MEIFQKTYEIGVHDCDLFGRMKPGQLLRYLQDCATLHCEGSQVSRDSLLKDLNGIWILMRIKISLNRPILLKDNLTIKTYHRGLQKSLLIRDFQLLVNNEVVGSACSGWVVIDIVLRQILRSQKIMDRIDFVPKEFLLDEIRLDKIKTPEESQVLNRHQVCYTDLDYNEHLNNTVYADIITNSVKMHLYPDRFISTLQINYLKEIKADEEIEIRGSRSRMPDAIWGIVDGHVCFESIIEYGKSQLKAGNLS